MDKLAVIEKKELFGHKFKIYGTYEEPLFLAKDIATWLGYSDDHVGQMVSVLDDDEYTTSPLQYSAQVRHMYFVNEFGAYEILMQSRKPKAKEFKKGVKKILKQIRMQGYYIDEKAIKADILDDLLSGFGQLQDNKRQILLNSRHKEDKEKIMVYESRLKDYDKLRDKCIRQRNKIEALEERNHFLEGCVDSLLDDREVE